MPDSRETEAILTHCRELGFALAGVAEAAPTCRADEVTAWLNAGKHGEMEYLARNLESRLDPRKLLPGAKSIICVADRYHDGRPDRRTGSPTGRIARYARGADYHVVMKKRLHVLCDRLKASFPIAEFRACVDTTPILEREHAARAGLGAIGKHTLLIEPGVGSYLLLGEVLSTLALEPSTSMDGVDVCAPCARCIAACPTDAITPYSVDATKCISYLTIEHRSAIDERFHEPMGEWLFGCDICQEVCPHNQPTRRTQAAAVNPPYVPASGGRDSFDLLDVLNWDEQARREAFVRSAMKRAKLNMMKRNAIIAAGNELRRSDHPALRRRIEELAASESEDELVREAARCVSEAVKHTSTGR
jgi:epoxyqueuosine reductase